MTPTITSEAARLAEEARRRADTARHELLIAIYERHDVAAAFFAFDPLAVGKDRDAARDALCAYDQALNMKIDNLMALSALAKQDAAPTSASTVPAGFWLAPMEPDEEMWTEGRDPIMYRDLGDYRPASFDVPAWQREPDGSINHDKSKGTAAVRVWRAMRDSYLARNPGACSVTDGEAKK